jgi:zinc protease
MFEQEVKKVLQEIAEKGVKADELQRVKISVLASQVYKKDSVFGQAMEIGPLEMNGISWRKIDAIDEKIQTVNSDQIKEIVKKYITDDRLTIGVLKPVAVNKSNNSDRK